MLPTSNPPLSPHSLIERFISRLPIYPYSNHAQDVIRFLTLLSATFEPVPRSISRFTVLPAFTNQKGTLHGGAAAMIFDMCTSSTMALVPGEGLEGWANGGGVSRSLNVIYLEGVKEGEGVLIESEVVKAGKRLAQSRGVMRRERDGVIVATCEHGQVNTYGALSQNQEGKIPKGRGLNAARQRRNEQLMGEKPG